MTRIELVAVFIVALLGNMRAVCMEMPSDKNLHELRRIKNSRELDQFLKDLEKLEEAKRLRRRTLTPGPRIKPSIEEFLTDLAVLEEAKELRRKKRSLEQLKNLD